VTARRASSTPSCAFGQVWTREILDASDLSPLRFRTIRAGFITKRVLIENCAKRRISAALCPDHAETSGKPRASTGPWRSSRLACEAWSLSLILR
jgi:hypothetical protein